MSERHRRLGALTCALGVVACGLAGYAFHGSLPLNPLRLPGERKMETRVWAPEAWAFFTRDPQEESIRAYVRKDGAWQPAYHQLGSPEYAFGVNRYPRRGGMELAVVARALGGQDFVNCEDDPFDCAAKIGPSQTIANTVPEPGYCGEVLVVLQKPVPWVWARHGKTIHMPSRVARVEVTC